MSERSKKRELEAYLAEALREIDLGMFHFDPEVEAERTFQELLRMIRKSNVAVR